MNKRSTIVILFICLIYFAAYAQNIKSGLAERFIAFVNNHQEDSLKAIMADNFELKRTFTKFTHNKKAFLDAYIPFAKYMHAKFNIILTENIGQTTTFLVEDESDYFKCLKIDNPKWRIKITVNEQQKISSMVVDTTETQQKYIAQSDQKTEEFENWLKQQYPKEARDALYDNAELLAKRLKEYARK